MENPWIVIVDSLKENLKKIRIYKIRDNKSGIFYKNVHLRTLCEK